MQLIRSLIVVVCFILAIARASVVILDDNNYEANLSAADSVPFMIMYYAPWCMWSRAFLPIFDTASQGVGDKVKFGKVDCQANTRIMKEQQIHEFPTIKLHIDGQVIMYDGSRDNPASVISWINRHFDAVSEINDEKELNSFVSLRDIHVLGYFPTSDSNSAKNLAIFKRTAMHFDDIVFGQTNSSAVVNIFNAKSTQLAKLFNEKYSQPNQWEDKSQLLVITHHKNPQDQAEIHQFTMNDDAKSLHSFIQPLRTASVLQFSERTSSKAFSDPRPLFVFFLSKTDKSTNELMKGAFQRLAYAHKKDYLFVECPLESPLQKRLADLAGIDSETPGSLPTTRILTLNPDGHSNFYPALKYKGPSGKQLLAQVSTMSADNKQDDAEIATEAKEINEEYVQQKSVLVEGVMEEFLKKFKAGEVPPYLKSEPVPDDLNGPVKVLVGSTYEKHVFDSTKDVFVLLYAPWCGHCRNLEPEWKKLGRAVSGLKTLSITKMDATRNEVTNLKVKAYPTILLYTANRKSEPIEFSASKRTVEAMLEFLEANAFFKFNAKNLPDPVNDDIELGLLGEDEL